MCFRYISRHFFFQQVHRFPELHVIGIDVFRQRVLIVRRVDSAYSMGQNISPVRLILPDNIAELFREFPQEEGVNVISGDRESEILLRFNHI